MKEKGVRRKGPPEVRFASNPVFTGNYKKKMESEMKARK